ncbi:hypothetical protein FRB94_003591 [Tulasnella sp. JGI-2019a]|nr:hypothetical protein FRB94_003591 [Tulasnella sp. JGI-2019a]
MYFIHIFAQLLLLALVHTSPLPNPPRNVVKEVEAGVKSGGNLLREIEPSSFVQNLADRGSQAQLMRKKPVVTSPFVNLEDRGAQAQRTRRKPIIVSNNKEVVDAANLAHSDNPDHFSNPDHVGSPFPSDWSSKHPWYSSRVDPEFAPKEWSKKYYATDSNVKHPWQVLVNHETKSAAEWKAFRDSRAPTPYVAPPDATVLDATVPDAVFPDATLPGGNGGGNPNNFKSKLKKFFWLKPT